MASQSPQITISDSDPDQASHIIIGRPGSTSASGSARGSLSGEAGGAGPTFRTGGGSGSGSSSIHRGHTSTGSTSSTSFPLQVNTFNSRSSMSNTTSSPRTGVAHADAAEFDIDGIAPEYETDTPLERSRPGATYFSENYSPTTGAGGRSPSRIAPILRFILSRSRSRSLVLLFAISFALLSLLKATHPHLVPSPLHSFLPSTGSSSLLLTTSSPYVSPSTSSSPLPGHGGAASLSAASAWGLTGIPGGVKNSPTLDERLRVLLEKPALMHWEMEVVNRHECPMYTYDRNTYFFHEGKEDEWHRLNSGDVVRYRNTLIAYLKELEDEGVDLLYKDKGMGLGGVKRGLIVTGGDGQTLERLQLSLTMLRKTLGCKLPIEVYHFPDEMQDPEIRQAFIDEFDVQLKVVEMGKFGGKNWHIKTAAFIQTEFVQFLYLDSDNIPLTDPTELFESAELKLGGSVFWSDLYKDHPDNSIWRVLGRPCSDMHWPAEAGQILFDKRGNGGLNLAVLHIANHMMIQPEMYGFLSYGDKDTFRFAFYALSLPYQQAPRIFATIGGFQTQGGESSPDYFCGHSMLQWGLTPWKKRNDATYHPKPAFLHTILGKHRRNLQPDKLWSHLRRPRLDGISEPLLVRTPYHFSGDCFALSLKGPDGLDSSENSMRDGQGVVTETLEEVLGSSNPVYVELVELAKKFVKITRD